MSLQRSQVIEGSLTVTCLWPVSFSLQKPESDQPPSDPHLSETLSLTSCYASSGSLQATSPGPWVWQVFQTRKIKPTAIIARRKIGLWHVYWVIGTPSAPYEQRHQSRTNWNPRSDVMQHQRDSDCDCLTRLSTIKFRISVTVGPPLPC